MTNLQFEGQKSLKLSNGNTIEYVICNGTYYHKQTPLDVIRALEVARIHDKRIRVFYGDTESGKCWLEEHDVLGGISRSSGNVKVPILISRKNSWGGTSMLDHCIVRITVDKKDVYKHKNFHIGEITMKDCNEQLSELGYTTSVYVDGENVANFKSQQKAEKWIKFIKGESNRK